MSRQKTDADGDLRALSALEQPRQEHITTLPLALRSGDAPAESDPAISGRSAGSFLVDATGHVLAFDRGMERLLGWSSAEVIGRSKNAAGAEAAAEEEEGVPLYAGSLPVPIGPQRRTLSLYRRDGAIVEALVALSPLGDSGRVQVAVERVLARYVSPLDPEVAHEYDPLTRLPLPLYFSTNLNEALDRCRERGAPLSVLVAEPDLAHELRAAEQGGELERLLYRVAGMFRAAVRESDAISRLEGDDFALMLETAGRADARLIGGRLRAAVESFGHSGAFDLGHERLTVSVGAACFPADGDNAEDLLHRARLALREAQRLGRNRVWCYVRRPRIASRFPVYFDGPIASLLGMSRDLSHSGLFVETEDPLPVGMRMAMVLALPDEGAHVRVVGRVARAQSSVGHRGTRAPGLGVEFERFDEDARARIEAFVQQVIAERSGS